MNVERTNTTTVTLSKGDVLSMLKAHVPENIEVQAIPQDYVLKDANGNVLNAVRLTWEKTGGRHL